MTNTKTKTMTTTNTFREHLQRAIPETCDLWDIWSEWWGDITWPDIDKDKHKYKHNDKDKYLTWPKKKTMTKPDTKTKKKTMSKTFREHLQRAIPETCDLCNIWSEWWVDMTRPKRETITMTNTETKTMTKTNTFREHLQRVILETCEIWDTDYNFDNWELDFMTIFVTWQLIVTLDAFSILAMFTDFSFPTLECREASLSFWDVHLARSTEPKVPWCDML